MSEQPNNPLHGITLEKIVTQLEQHYGWAALAKRIDIRCFKSDPSIKSSLKFLRKTPWARTKVENLYLRTSFNKPAKAPAKSGAKPSTKPNRKTTQPGKAPHQQVAATGKTQTTINQKAEQTPKTPEPEATAAIEAATTATSSENTENTTTTDTDAVETTSAAATSNTTTESPTADPATSKTTKSVQNKRRFSGGNSANNKRRF